MVVTYDVSREPAFAVQLDDRNSDFDFDLWRLARMRGLATQPPAGALTAGQLIGECERAKTVLRTSCAMFLEGKADAFRRESREAALVEKIREMARSAYFDGNYRIAVQLYDAMRDYWDERDQETFDLARAGETPLMRAARH